MLHYTEPEDHVALLSHIQRSLSCILQEIIKFIFCCSDGKAYTDQRVAGRIVFLSVSRYSLFNAIFKLSF